MATELYRGARSYRENLTHFLGQGSFVAGYRPELERSRSGECALSGADRVRTRRTRTLYASHRNVGKIRHKGLLFGIELVEDRETRTPATAERVAKVISGCKERGLIVGKNGDTVAGFNNVITLAPPLVVSDDDLEFISGALSESLRSL